MKWPNVQNPEKYVVDDSSIIFPVTDSSRIEIITGPNIVPFPDFEALPDNLEAEIIIKLGDNISTDTIMPAGNKVLPFRSNIPAISQFVFEQIDPEFHKRAQDKGCGVIIAGDNYGQGSSREHAALAPRYLGIRVKIAKSFARIHKANLVNFGIVPLIFKDPSDYDVIQQGDILTFSNIRSLIANGESEIVVESKGRIFTTILDVSEKERLELLAGGTLNFVKQAK
jgi:aconitate hydratase